ncbi:hypothetical protein ACLBYD_04590 [Rhodococcus sp. C26F]
MVAFNVRTSGSPVANIAQSLDNSVRSVESTFGLSGIRGMIPSVPSGASRAASPVSASRFVASGLTTAGSAGTGGAVEIDPDSASNGAGVVGGDGNSAEIPFREIAGDETAERMSAAQHFPLPQGRAGPGSSWRNSSHWSRSVCSSPARESHATSVTVAWPANRRPSISAPWKE